MSIICALSSLSFYFSSCKLMTSIISLESSHISASVVTSKRLAYNRLMPRSTEELVPRAPSKAPIDEDAQVRIYPCMPNSDPRFYPCKPIPDDLIAACIPTPFFYIPKSEERIGSYKPTPPPKCYNRFS